MKNAHDAKDKSKKARGPSGESGGRLPGEKPDRARVEKARSESWRKEGGFDTDVEDVRAYRERQESYINDLGNDTTNGIGNDPGTFEN